MQQSGVTSTPASATLDQLSCPSGSDPQQMFPALTTDPAMMHMMHTIPPKHAPVGKHFVRPHTNDF